ncbi:MAG: hypothetical protein M1834_001164 [Cirrosporium novae-zelandiae]|nr:MAG: hypothetical protein M1834_001164 [Cirrosporium novae-zelandiae]
MPPLRALRLVPSRWLLHRPLPLPPPVLHPPSNHPLESQSRRLLSVAPPFLNSRPSSNGNATEGSVEDGQDRPSTSNSPLKLYNPLHLNLDLDFEKFEDFVQNELQPLLFRSKEQGPTWEISKNEKGIQRSFRFKGFKGCWDFMNVVAAKCKEEKHHPTWTNTYNKVVIQWTTHSLDALSEKDIKMAKFCDEQAIKFGELGQENEVKGCESYKQGRKEGEARSIYNVGFYNNRSRRILYLANSPDAVDGSVRFKFGDVHQESS